MIEFFIALLFGYAGGLRITDSRRRSGDACGPPKFHVPLRPYEPPTVIEGWNPETVTIEDVSA